MVVLERLSGIRDAAQISAGLVEHLAFRRHEKLTPGAC